MSFSCLSVLKKLSHAVSAVLVLSPLSLAQHNVAPAPHPPVAPVHVAPPPVSHPPALPRPIVQPPVVRPPVSYAPNYVLPRSGILPSANGLGTHIVLPPVRPIRPIRPVPPVIFIYSPRFVFGEPFWTSNYCRWERCDPIWPWTYGYSAISSPGPVNYVSQPIETPVYVYGGEREDFPELFLKDGTILNVTDYWVVEGQLHFKITEAIGQKPVEQSIPFEELDLQTTIDANTRRGFRFVLRNEPLEEYIRDHPEGPPPVLTVPHK